MKKIVFVFVPLFSLLLVFSCQKEISSEIIQRGNGIDSDGIGLLNKNVSTDTFDNRLYHTGNLIKPMRRKPDITDSFYNKLSLDENS